uniref:Uncharacterized protein n=1 Tax=Cucumis melo TaxID=3656 RepID=A0A9I9E9L8_CUCME
MGFGWQNGMEGYVTAPSSFLLTISSFQFHHFNRVVENLVLIQSSSPFQKLSYLSNFHSSSKIIQAIALCSSLVSVEGSLMGDIEYLEMQSFVAKLKYGLQSGCSILEMMHYKKRGDSRHTKTLAEVVKMSRNEFPTQNVMWGRPSKKHVRRSIPDASPTRRWEQPSPDLFFTNVFNALTISNPCHPQFRRDLCVE